jgi:hypothetical protein
MSEGHVANVWEIRNEYKIILGKPEGNSFGGLHRVFQSSSTVIKDVVGKKICSRKCK